MLRKSLFLLTLILLTAAFQTPSSQPQILSFTATPSLVRPIDGEFTIAWEAANAEAVMLWWYSHEGESVENLDLPLAGSMTLSAHDLRFNDGHVRINLKLTELGSDRALPNAETGGFYETSIDVALETPIEIVNFSANPVPVIPGGTLTLDWDVRNAERVDVRYFDDSMIPISLFSPDGDTPVPIQGSYTLDMPNHYIGRKIAYQLYAIDANGVWITRTLELDAQCYIPDYIAPQCPYRQFETTLRWQPFDGGMMLAYEPEEQSLQPAIQLLLNNGRTVIDGAGARGEPLAGTLTPLPDHFPPDPLFETLWREYAPVREALGYATAPLQTYTTLFEMVSESDYAVIQSPYLTYLRWVDGRVMEISISTGSWRFVGE